MHALPFPRDYFQISHKAYNVFFFKLTYVLRLLSVVENESTKKISFIDLRFLEIRLKK